MIRIGTSCFVSIDAAVRYYRSRGDTDPIHAVARKLAAGEIHLGEPQAVYPDEVAVLDTLEGRYYIEERK